MDEMRVVTLRLIGSELGERLLLKILELVWSFLSEVLHILTLSRLRLISLLQRMLCFMR
jgi:hypothetical protein